MNFIYVMREADKDKMISLGYSIIKEDKRNHVWVFQNKDTTTFACEDEISNAGIPICPLQHSHILNVRMGG